MSHLRTVSLFLLVTVLLIAAAPAPIVAQPPFRQYLPLVARQEPPFLVGTFEPDEYDIVLLGKTIALGDQLFFTVQCSQLWVTRDAPDSAAFVRDFGATLETTKHCPATFILASVGNVVLVSSFDRENNLNLWRSDGSSNGTELLSLLVPSNASASLGYWPVEMLGTAADQVFFRVKESEEVWSLWRSDGSSGGTLLLHRFPECSTGSNCFRAVIGDDQRLFLLLNDYSDDNTTGSELWVSDGSIAGTRQVRVFESGTHVNTSAASIMNDTLFFVTSRTLSITPPTSKPELWASDGSLDGTQRIAALGDFSPRISVATPGRLWLSGYNYHGARLWFSDGTGDGARPLTSFDGKLVCGMVISNDVLYFTEGYDPFCFGPRHLWRSDGTEAGTLVVLSADRYDYGLQVLNNQLYFVGTEYRAETGDVTGLYQSDGTVAGTVRVFGEPDIRIVGDFLSTGSHFLFQASTDATGSEPWVSNGTAAGTRILADTRPGSASSRDRQWLSPTSSAVFFRTKTSEGAIQFWAVPFVYLP